MNKRAMWTAVAVVVIALIVFGIYKGMDKNNSADQNTTNNSQQNSSNQTGDNTSGQDVVTPPAGGTGKLSYTEALKKYGTNRIQFDSTCQAKPNNVAFKAGTDVMFDNRAKATRTINFNGIKYTVKAEDYFVVRIAAASYPSTVLIDCDKSQNVATVLIQR